MGDFTRIHFIGIGGIGMSALARLLLHEGKQVSGSDRALSDITRKLQKEGAIVFDAVSADNITDDIELIVYSGAVKENDPERIATKEKGIKELNYFEALALVVNRYKLIAVAGTHGKTTTTAMLTDVFEAARKDPTAIIGSLRAATKSNFRAGKSEYAIVEACEYKRHALNLEPDVLIITNVEFEHVDYYKDLADVQSMFSELAAKVPEEGCVVCDSTHENVKPILDGVKATVIDYRQYVDPLRQLSQPGIHNQQNAAAAIAAAASQGIDIDVAKEALRNFKGTWRRFEYKGDVKDAKIYDDYSHHPTEIRAALQGARELYPDKRITVVFQPHTYTRTKTLFNDFARELARADRIILAPIYAAREENEGNVSSEELALAIQKMNPNVTSFETFDEIIAAVKETAGPDDVIIVMGAGDITKVAVRLVS